jgi:hypothetical protein
MDQVEKREGNKGKISVLAKTHIFKKKPPGEFYCILVVFGFHLF